MYVIRSFECFFLHTRPTLCFNNVTYIRKFELNVIRESPCFALIYLSPLVPRHFRDPVNNWSKLVKLIKNQNEQKTEKKSSKIQWIFFGCRTGQYSYVVNNSNSYILSCPIPTKSSTPASTKIIRKISFR